MLNKELMFGVRVQAKVGTLTVDTTRMSAHYVRVHFSDGTVQDITLDDVYKYPNNTVLNVQLSSYLELINPPRKYVQSVYKHLGSSGSLKGCSNSRYFRVKLTSQEALYA